jgi:DNA-binding NarL/FixJ family response regulator
MLLDRVADIHMARRSGADGWTIKPLDALRLRKAVREIAAGGCYAEGLPVPEVETDDVAGEEPESGVEPAESLA